MGYTTEAYVCLKAGDPITLEKVHYNDLGDRELLIEGVAVSMCHTDIRASQGGFWMEPPMILGHESAGIVKEVGRFVTNFNAGDSVVLSYSSCGNCKRCQSGRSAYCDNLASLNFGGRRLDGSVAATDKDGNPLNSHFFGQSSMSRLIVAHEMGAIKVDVTREELKKFAALGCGIQTGAGTIMYVKPRNCLLPLVRDFVEGRGDLRELLGTSCGRLSTHQLPYSVLALSGYPPAWQPC